MAKRLAYRDATTGSWTWNRQAVAQEGLRLPGDITNGPDDIQHDHKEEDIQQDADMKVEGEWEATENVDADKDGAATPREGQVKHHANENEHDKERLKTLTKSYSAPTCPALRPVGAQAAVGSSSHSELADHARQVIQRERERETKHSLMVNIKTMTVCIMIINVHMPTAWQNIKELPDEPHCVDELMDQLCRAGSHRPTTIMIGDVLRQGRQRGGHHRDRAPEAPPMFGWRPSVSTTRRLARAWAEWTPATIGDARREVQKVASAEAEWLGREGPQFRSGASAQERRLCELHVKLERQRSAAAAIGAGNGGTAAPRRR